MKANQSAVNHADSVTAFPKKYRLTKTDEFSSVFGFRKALKSAHFLLHYRLRSVGEPEEARLGLVVPKRVLKRSVDRNLVRRLARESFRKLHHGLPSRDFIVRLMRKPESLDRTTMATEIQLLLGKMIASDR